MATATAPSVSSLPIHRLDVGTYGRMVDSGALEGEPVELLEGLLVEVSFSSPRIDRGIKAELYARAGVPTCWLVDVLGKTVEVRTDPSPDGYRGCEVYGLGTAVPSPAPGVADLDVTPCSGTSRR